MPPRRYSGQARRSGTRWFFVLRRGGDGGRVWFYRDETVCRRVFGEWAGHGDPEGFDFSWEIYAIPQTDVIGHG